MKQSRCSRRRSDAIHEADGATNDTKARLCAADAPQRRRGDFWTQRALATIPNGYTEMRAQLNLRLAAAYARLGHFDEARRALAEANRIWPYDTVRNHWPEDPQATCTWSR